jgi:uncharacterized membrane protein
MVGPGRFLFALLVMGAAAACQPAEQAHETRDPGIVESSGPAFDAIGADETVSFTGTEPFWGGEVAKGQLVYRTPENPGGEAIAVRRFAGNNGLGISGALAGRPFDLTITPGACSDGMSDRSYPYIATLQLGAEQRSGCAWTARQPFSGSPRP